MDCKNTNIKSCFLRNKLKHVSLEAWITLCKPTVKFMIATTLCGQATVRDKVLDYVNYLTIVVFIACVGEVALQVCRSFYYALFTFAVLLPLLLHLKLFFSTFREL